jgi:acyl transferase domain-containing protein
MSIASLSSNFGDAVMKMAGRAARYLPEPVASGASFLGSLSEAKSSNTVDISPQYQELLEKQIQAQSELQQVTFTSNIERSQHESRMAAVRNIRVS